MNRKITIGAALAFLLVVAAFVFSFTMNYATRNFNRMVSDLRNRETISEKYAEIDDLVRNNYYQQINETQLLDSLAHGYIDGIGDQYSRYLSADEYKKMTQESDGNVGIGAEIEIAPDDFYLLVKEVYPDSPAEVAGIQAGDRIIKIDDTDLSRENSRQMLDAIQGPEGSKITLVTRRGGTDSGILDMTRRAVSQPTVLYSRMLQESTVGYLYIKEFTERTYDQFNRELLRLMDSGATSLVIDLRDNKSDYLQTATRVLDKLLPAGVLVNAVRRDGTVEMQVTSDANAIDIPIVVIINSNTVGVPEVFAQVIKDYEKGRTVGTLSAGKNVMQKILKLSDGSALDLAVATYQTSSGEDFGGGVKPDFDVSMEADWTGLVEVENADPQLVKAKEVAMSLEDPVEVPQSSSEPEPLPERSTESSTESPASGEADAESGDDSSTDDTADETGSQSSETDDTSEDSQETSN